MVREGHQKGIRKNEGADGLLRLTLTKAVRLIASIDFERVNTVHIITHCKFIDKRGIKPKSAKVCLGAWMLWMHRALRCIIKYYLDQWYIN